MMKLHVVKKRKFGDRLVRLVTLPVLLITILAIFGSSPIFARTIAVPGNAPSIKGAMIQAQSGDIILVSCGTYRENDIWVKAGVSLWSSTLQPDCVTIDAGDQGRCLIFSNADSNTNLVGFTLRGGRASPTNEQGRGGAILCQNSAPNITRCNFIDNNATAGGALAVMGTQGPRLKQCRFSRNEAANQGGAIFWTGQSGSLQDCTLVLNHALVSGGALAAEGGNIVIEGSLIRANSAGNAGGGLSFVSTKAAVTRTVLAENLGGLAGGAVACRDASPTFKNCTLHANDADGQGTVLSLAGSHPVFESCVITGSSSALIEATDSQPTMTQSNILPTAERNWPGTLAAQQEAPGNLTVDPLYCAPEAGDYHLQPGSPCLAPAGAGHIGALGQGCGAQFPADVVN